ncbi:GldG family protein [Steroidobacter cummioxidans]|uniref:GldG family protein n=1 Tax=Steroidobacter cummioxidans TaxID=1803913 RepID=UPI000E318A0E|nr:Gldg family protein [Steroidobacter cummioxidans]
MTTKTRKTYGATALVALALLFIGATILITFVFRGARLDLTESKLYSLAPGTEKIVSTLDEPINLYFFFSQDASAQQPQLRAYAQRVRELLEEMSQHSKGKLRLSVIDPQPFSEDEDRATEFGLSPVSATPGGEPMYFGLAGTNSTDGREIIGLFQPDKEEFLEYDVASLIYRLSNAKRSVVGLISSLPVEPRFDQMSGQMSPGWASIQQLRESLDVRTLQADGNDIPADIGVLMIVHPKDLSPQMQYAIDQFVMRGGKLITFMDPQSENDNAGAQMGMPPMAGRSSTLGPLLDTWGVKFDTNEIVGDRELGLTVSLQQGKAPSQHIAILGLNRASMNPKDVTVSTLDTINVMTAGALSKKEDATIDFEPLLQSSTNAALLPAAKLMFLPDSDSLLDGFKPTGERYTIAARIHGKLKSAFPNGKPRAEGAAGPHLTETKDDANVILVADTDLLADPLWVRTQNVFGQRFAVAWANNGDFLANSVDNLAGSADLISVRGRQSFFRPFTKVDELRRQAGDQLRAKEKELDQELKETEQKLSALEAGRGGAQAAMSLSAEQEAELERFQHERVRIRKELRDTRRSLDVEIEALGTRLKVINIALVPALLALGAIFLEIVRRRRLRAGRAAAHTG